MGFIETLRDSGIEVKKGITHTKIIDVIRKIQKHEYSIRHPERRKKFDRICISCGRKFQVWQGLKRAKAKKCRWCS